MTEHRRPGRPQIADPDAIALIAVGLFAERGFDAVTMDDIAAASGISRRTLFRHFATKNDLVWRDFFATYERISRRMEQSPPAPGIAGLRDVMREGLAIPEGAEENARIRLRIIGDSPEVFSAGIAAMSDVRDTLAQHFARGHEGEGMPLEPWTTAYAVLAGMLAASVWWAKKSEEPLADVVDQALVRLQAGLA
ncbi:TetR family transcriptional regulator [Demequina sp. SYSU T00039]|uniref:TetR family transcriptional regulator n=1 Tax=Demequina lignilytica TaxID=3051663 RepID=A0AAW7M7J4_9MICO|nr:MULTISPECIES: TetR family transcriptional regulator [unclassified Demequina]MDN4478518.1 TetR family transcriptional regulator [Demequina sp. SYSU T00039-1]MDN4486975.1 TetR family transcriptional regulator [Demequina sp. SYSU T00039]